MLTGRCKKLPLSGELANAVSLRGFVSRSGAANAAFRYAPPVKRRLERSAERDKRKIKIIFR